jgi:hypothetical protein
VSLARFAGDRILVDVPVVVVVLEAAGGLDRLKEFNDRVEAARYTSDRRNSNRGSSTQRRCGETHNWADAHDGVVPGGAEGI